MNADRLSLWNIGVALLFAAVSLMGAWTDGGLNATPTIAAHIWTPIFWWAGLRIYLAPWYRALKRHHPQAAAIGLIDVLLGWTFVGWVVAAAWCETISGERCSECLSPCPKGARRCSHCGAEIIKAPPKQRQWIATRLVKRVIERATRTKKPATPATVARPLLRATPVYPDMPPPSPWR